MDSRHDEQSTTNNHSIFWRQCGGDARPAQGTGGEGGRFKLCPSNGGMQGDQCMVWRRTLDREELTPVEARQGFLDRPVLAVLIASVIMVCILFGLLRLGI
jgi:hypothetical protein